MVRTTTVVHRTRRSVTLQVAQTPFAAYNTVNSWAEGGQISDVPNTIDVLANLPSIQVDLYPEVGRYVAWRDRQSNGEVNSIGHSLERVQLPLVTTP